MQTTIKPVHSDDAIFTLLIRAKDDWEDSSVFKKTCRLADQIISDAERMACLSAFVASRNKQLDEFPDWMLELIGKIRERSLEEIASETTPLRTDLSTWWDGWVGFPAGEGGWIVGAHKWAALDIIGQHEDYKGLLDFVRFWDRAKDPIEIRHGHRHGAVGSEAGLASLYRIDECAGTTVSDSVEAGGDISLLQMAAGFWSSDNAPVSDAAELEPRLVTEWQPDGSLHVIMLGTPGLQHDLVRSDFLGGWQTATSLTFDRTVHGWVDSSAIAGRGSFYRLDQYSP